MGGFAPQVLMGPRVPFTNMVDLPKSSFKLSDAGRLRNLEMDAMPTHPLYEMSSPHSKGMLLAVSFGTWETSASPTELSTVWLSWYHQPSIAPVHVEQWLRAYSSEARGRRDERPWKRKGGDLPIAIGSEAYMEL
ncbi:hypothetical protein DCS_07410 [Drechmeria coniospora]|uniref:Uncharacterized protein n=1 Tax=Drechmeria coniospora TaxID=98403 RepID=A0A151GEC6_DRECN|nr:hypothetical protein DCS_07410 [Drechmeria coniospora]KYK55447.1 hypothetical protein DCS_07410 [Drechmeria coniospora]